MIKRTINLPHQKSFFIFGPRQTGKSTLLNFTFPKEHVLYYNLLLSDEYRRLSARPEVFREEVLSRNKNKSHVILDEVQRIPELLNEVHALIESPGAPYFCMSGSSARKLKKSHANLLAGRAWTYYLHPFTHIELGEHFSLEKALRFGTLPPVYLSENEENTIKTLKSYTETYLKEEVEAESLLRKIASFHRFMPLAASENGNVINFSAIARETGTTYKTVREYFKIFEDTLIGFFLYPYISSWRKRLVKHPKFYFFDIGVARAIAGKSAAVLEPGTREYGKAFEHFIVLEIIRLRDYAEKDLKISFFRTEQGTEVDLILENPDGRIFAVEVKASIEPHSSELRGLKSFARDFPQAELICICLAPKQRETDGIKIMPWRDFFAHIGLIKT